MVGPSDWTRAAMSVVVLDARCHKRRRRKRADRPAGKGRDARSASCHRPGTPAVAYHRTDDPSRGGGHLVRYVDVGGLRLSAVGLGTWQFGSREWQYGETYAREVAPAILRRAIELGVTLV